MERLNAHARQLPQLEIGERVFIQNQNGPHPNKWDRSGIVLESLGHDQYTVKVDGSGRLTKRNRRFLRHYTLPGRPVEKWSSYDQPSQTDQLLPQSSAEHVSPYEQFPPYEQIPQEPVTQQFDEPEIPQFSRSEEPQIETDQQLTSAAPAKEMPTPLQTSHQALPQGQSGVVKKPRGRS